MENNVHISIIVPVYNVEKYLSYCLDSLVNQTMKEIEIILVNDGSTDNSGEICKKYAETDDRIKYIVQKNSGLSATRNVGITLANGEFIMFVDSDDWIDPDICEYLYKVAEKHKTDYLFGSYYNESTIGTKEKIIYQDNEIVYDKKQVQTDLLKNVIGLTGKKLRHPEKIDTLTPVWARLYRTSIIKNNNIQYIDLNLVPSECQLFNCHYLMNANSAIYIRKPIYHYRRNNNLSVTKGYRTGLLKKWIYWINSTKEYIEKNDMWDELKDAYYSRICFSVIPLGGNAIKKNTLKEILSEIKEFLNDEHYIEAFKELDFSYFKIHWKVFFYLAKYRCTFGFYLMTKIMRTILAIRKK